MTSVKDIKKLLCKNIKLLSKKYKSALKNGGAGANEWLRDNYYLLSREGENAFCELDKFKHLTVLHCSGDGVNENPPSLRIASEKSVHDGYPLRWGRGQSSPSNTSLDCRTSFAMTGVGNGVIPAFSICMEAAKSGKHFYDALKEPLASANLSTFDLEAIPVLMKACFVILAAKSFDADEQGSGVGNAVMGMRAMPSADFDGLIEEFCVVDKIFKSDPTGTYLLLDDATKSLYCHSLSKIARHEKISEKKAAQEILNKAANAKTERERHVGFYLLEDTVFEKRKKTCGYLFLSLRIIIPVVISAIIAYLLNSFLLFFLLYLPVFEIVRPFIEYIFSHFAKPRYLPRLLLEGNVPNSAKTLVTVACLVPSPEKAKKAAKSLLMQYLTNPSQNIGFCLLADLKESDSPYKSDDKMAIDVIKSEIEQLNAKYGNKFYLIVRKRSMIKTQKAFAGYERKRGAITELIEIIKGKKPSVACVTGDMSFLRSVRYIITLDADTKLLIDSVSNLVSAAMHPLNKGVVDTKTKTVKHGFGIIAPRISTELSSAGKTPFSRIMSGSGGVTAYNALSGDLYADFFGCSIFAGKGLIDVDVYHQCIKDAIPDERVLSHDIIETGFLRSAYMSDIEVTDGCPPDSTSFFSRMHRWVRGDWQNIIFLFSKIDGKKNNFSCLSKHMLFDNLRRSLTPVMAVMLIITGILCHKFIGFLLTTAMLSVLMPYLFSTFMSVINGGIQALSRKYYSHALPSAAGSLTQGFVSLISLVYIAYISLDAIIKAVYRQFISRKNLLSWVTAADSENSRSNIFFEYKRQIASVLFGVLLIINTSSLARLLGILTVLCPVIFIILRIENKKTKRIITKSQKEKLQSYACDMWRYYSDLCGIGDNYLPPDNIQESPVPIKAHRTSPTNISLYMLCILSARDFGFISTDDMASSLMNTLDTVEKLEKYNGNLLNWYDTKTCKPLYPRYVSTVDSGNFACYFIALSEGLCEYISENGEIKNIIKRINKIIDNTDVSFLYDKKRHLFHIGFDVEKNELSDCYYDILMSEARMTSYFAIAKRQIPKKHYGALSRTLSRIGSFTGPVSWTGTMFEYFMPYTLLPAYENSLDYEALRFCLHCQKKRGEEKNAPFGTSESCFYAFDPQFNYQYKAHGVGKLGLKRRLNLEYIVSPYSTFLTLPIGVQTGLKNLKRLENIDAYGKYGFYEAVDYTKQRLGGKDYAIVRCFMAHHVGMSLISVANTLFDDVFQKRFMKNIAMLSASELLLEKIPAGTKVYPNDIEPEIPDKKGRYSGAFEEYTDISPVTPRVHLLSNGGYTLHISDCGTGVSRVNGANLNTYSSDILRNPNGIFAFVSAGNERFSITRAPDYTSLANYRVEFAKNYAAFFASKNGIEAGMQIVLHKTAFCEQRRFIIKNSRNKKQNIKLDIYFEPCLINHKDFSAHPAYSKLFINIEYDKETNSIICSRRKKDSEETVYLCVGFSDSRDFIYENNREKVLVRPEGIASVEKTRDYIFTSGNGLPDPCVFLRTNIKIPAHSKEYTTLLFCSAGSKEEAVTLLSKSRNNGDFPMRFAAMSPLGDNGMESRLGGIILPKLLYPSGTKKYEMSTSDINGLWGLGISGDKKIVLIQIKKGGDISLIESYIRFHKRLFDCGECFDLVILYNDGGEYTRPVFDSIREYISFSESSDLLFKNGGIHLFDYEKLDSDIVLLLLNKAAIVVNDKIDPRDFKIIPYKPFKIQKVNPAVYDDTGTPVKSGIFNDGAFKITDKTPLPWCHILEENGFGTLVSNTSLGYTWYKNARENKLTTWNNDTASDNNGEMLILLYNGNYYNLCNGAYVEYNKNSAVYKGIIDELKYILTVTIRENSKIYKLELSAESADISLLYYTEPVMGVDRENAGMIFAENVNGILTLKNSFNSEFDGKMQITASEQTKFTLSRNKFFAGKFDNKIVQSEDICAALCIEKSFVKSLSVYFTLRYIPQQKVKIYDDSINKIIISTPDKILNEMFNTWLPIQIERARINARTGFYQCGGAFGFRDQLQDATALLLWNKNAAKRHILRAAAHQFTEGDVLHWWHELKSGHSGVRTKCSDDKLWLPYTVFEYVSKTGDYSILDEVIPYLTGEPLTDNEHERYFVPQISDEKNTLYEHCLRTIYNVQTGKNGLPLIGNGDWNDGFSKVGVRGIGESVWLAQFLSMVSNSFAGICFNREDTDNARILLEKAEALKQAVDTCAWDGEWYTRAFFDDGKTIGAKGNAECEIDILPQAFAVFSNMSDKERVLTALRNALNRLVDHKKGIIKLFTPPFDSEYDPGYIKGYQPGVRENGGQYSHAAVWLACAVLQSGFTDEGYKLMQYLLPSFHSSDPEYKTEPYYMAADIYTNENAYGRGGWSIYTGAAAWYYKTVLYNLLGVVPKNNTIEITPNLPDDWNEFKIDMNYNGTLINIHIKKINNQHQIRSKSDKNNTDKKITTVPLDEKSHNILIEI